MKKRISSVVMILIFLCGFGVFMYPLATRWIAKYQSNHVLDEFKSDLKILQQESAKIEKGEVSETGNELARLYQDMKTYNERIYENGQDDLKDPFAYETPVFDLTEYGFTNNVMGIIQIPKMDVELPMYLGATKDNMAKGAVVLGNTSMPVGGINSNVVIAAHRGYKGIKMFRDIQKMQIGDAITLTTPWDTLSYRVSEIKIVEKNDIGEVLIQKDQDMITLVTCHPYTKNTHRYLVFAKRVSNNQAVDSEEYTDSETVQLQDDSTNDSNSSYLENEEDATYSETQIWLEDNLMIIGGAVIMGMIVIGMIVTRDKTAKKTKKSS